MFTDQESENLEDVKLDIRRRFDIKTSKNDIARAAVAKAIADYESRGEQSALVQSLREKQSR